MVCSLDGAAQGLVASFASGVKRVKQRFQPQSISRWSNGQADEQVDLPFEMTTVPAGGGHAVDIMGAACIRAQPVIAFVRGGSTAGRVETIREGLSA